jgi:hypothetical protein
MESLPVENQLPRTLAANVQAAEAKQRHLDIEECILTNRKERFNWL